MVNVAPSASMVLTASAGSKRPDSARVPPPTSASAPEATAPVMWKRGAAAYTTSSSLSPIQSPNRSTVASTLPWVFIAPFGGPVVPEV